VKHQAKKNIFQQALELGSSIGNEKKHPLRVGKLACLLFDDLQPLHQMGNTERIWLYVAALLHDISETVNEKNHHEKSFEIIAGSSELGIDKEQRKIIGLIAMYHCGPKPQTCDKYFHQLNSEQKYYVRKLAALLRLADGLDSKHNGSVSDISCDITQDNIIIKLETSGPFNPRKAISKSDLLEDVFGRQIVILEQTQPVYSAFDIEPPD
jgi:exopolyphosphatase/guanosine-5'-triphosphate,3'-diphosphate pyrophosphatase